MGGGKSQRGISRAPATFTRSRSAAGPHVLRIALLPARVPSIHRIRRPVFVVFHQFARNVSGAHPSRSSSRSRS